MISIHEPLAQRFLVDAQGRIRVQYFAPHITVPAQPWTSLEELYKAEGLHEGWRAFQSYVETARTRSAILPPLFPEELLPQAVLDRRAQAKRVAEWKPPVVVPAKKARTRK